jgi:hypothetical protein
MLIAWMLAGSAHAGVDIEISCALEMANDKLLLYINNVGSTDSRGFYVDVFLDHPHAPVVGEDLSDYYVWVSAVPANSTEGREVTIPGLASWPGGWVDVMADSTSRVSETNEDNVKSMISDCCYVHTHFGFL